LLFDSCPYGKPCMDISIEQVRDALLTQVVKNKEELVY